jgi:hypothetical protein
MPPSPGLPCGSRTAILCASLLRPIHRLCGVMLVGSWDRVRGCRGGGPGRWIWTDGSTESDVVMVVISLFGHVDGVERTVGDPGVGNTLDLAPPRPQFGDLT